jgi:photosystem II stability/assembly factor-like uncharacterized protein
MKKLTNIFILFIIFSGYAFTQDYIWKPIPSFRDPLIIRFFTNQKGFILGSNYESQTTNGGIIWTDPGYIEFLNYSNVSFNNSTFPDSVNGWISAGSNYFLRTTNSGNLWMRRQIDTLCSVISSISFIDINTGWIIFPTGNTCRIKKSTNTGYTWKNIYINYPSDSNTVQQLLMISANKGFIINKNGIISLTTNGGINWNNTNLSNNYLVKIQFFDLQNGVILCKNNSIYKTTDGGVSWIAAGNTITNATNMIFINLSTGWISRVETSSSYLYQSTNGGVNWNLNLTLYNLSIKDVYFKDNNSGWIIINDGTIMKTINGGINWDLLYNFPPLNLTSIFYSNENTGWVLSSKFNNQQSKIFKSTDAGLNWYQNFSIGNNPVRKIRFINGTTGFVICDSGTVFRTTNFGQNWYSVYLGYFSIKDIAFANNNTGWICGQGGRIFKTVNSGINWVQQTSETLKNLNSISALNENLVYIVGDSARLLKTTNGGTNWSVTQVNNYLTFNHIKFTSIQTGYITGYLYSIGYPVGFPIVDRCIFKTTDGGQYWFNSLHVSRIGSEDMHYNGVWFTDDLRGWAYTTYGDLLYTSNGGTNWIVQFTFPGSSYPFSYNDMNFLNQYTGWTVCSNGYILTTGTINVGIKKLASEIPKDMQLYQNYPNPFNSASIILFDIIKHGQVKLVIYDILGKEVTIIVNNKLSPGKYSYNFQSGGLSSGIYFYQLNFEDNFIITKKMIVVR